MVATSTPATAAETSLRQGMRPARIPEPCAMVIFGASGDLTRRKLIPALYNLAAEGWLPAGFTVIGCARHESTDDDFRERMKEAIDAFSRRPAQKEVWDAFSRSIFYITADLQDPNGSDTLRQRLDEIDQTRGTRGNRVFYLATPPSAYPEMIRQLGHSGLNRGGCGGKGWARLIIEKPFGHDLASARSLNGELSQVFSEDQIYRIDHYLGKETVQNIFVFRFANGIFEPIWNRRYVDHVQITVAEQVGVEGRAGYYDTAGAMRDIVQNHMLQLVALTAMEPPVSFDANSVRDEKVKVLHSIPTLDQIQVTRNVVRAQYGPGWINGQPVPAYYEEPGVAPNSTTETYVSMRMEIDNWRWNGVPFYLHTGKRLTKRVTQIDIEFKRPPFMLFKNTNITELQPNILSLRIQPNEGISLRFGAKVPGGAMRIRGVNMDFLYGSAFAGEPPEAYERLLLDCMLGDSTLFTRRDETEAAWLLINGVLEDREKHPATQIPIYEAGSWGPKEADALLERDRRNWRRL